MSQATTPDGSRRYNSYNLLLLLVAGFGGLLYGIDVGIIASALPYLEATSGFNGGQLSYIVAAVLLGSVFSTLFAGTLADALGRRPLMALSGTCFVASIPVIALSHGFESLMLGRLLQGVSAGLIGVVVPLYLAECLPAADRGKGTGIFQWLLTAGIVVAALIGIYFSVRVEAVAKLGDATALRDYKDHAWRLIFWASLPPGVLFVAGSLFVAESPRWLHRRGRVDAARAALLRSRDATQAEVELREMAEAVAGPAAGSGGSLLRRKYVLPFLLACVILACNQTTGVNSIIGYNTNILLQAGLSDVQAHGGYLVLTVVNFFMTIAGVSLVDRFGRKFLLMLGTGGVTVALTLVGLLFHRAEAQRVDQGTLVQAEVAGATDAKLRFDAAAAQRWLAGTALAGQRVSLVVIYAYGDFRAATPVVRSDDAAAAPLNLSRDSCVPANRVIAGLTHPFADFAGAQSAPLRIEHALLTPVPDARNGWLTAAGIFGFMAAFAFGPGICVWLALSELMPTRIRSNGMSLALLVNQAVSTGIAAVFLPTVGQYGYAAMFFGFAACTAVYFATAVFFLPETKGKTLEEIEAFFETGKGA